MGRIRRGGAVGLALTIAAGGLSGRVAAQQAPAKKAAPAPAAAAPAGSQSAWAKICERAMQRVAGKDGKQEEKVVNLCQVIHERFDGVSGQVLISAAVRQMEGEPKEYFGLMVPLGMLIPAGMRAAIYSKDLWEKAQKNEKIDESKLKGIKLDYTLCHAAGCTAEVEVTPELMKDLKTSGGLIVFTIDSAGRPVAFPVPLTGFEQAYSGAPMDAQKYAETRNALRQQIAQRKQQLDKQAAQQKAGQAPVPAQKK
jgi:invasion protein IalB